MSKQKDVSELEQLEIIETEALKVGNAFHAFRFSKTLGFDPDEKTRKLVDRAVKTLAKHQGIDEAEAIKLVEERAKAINPLATVAEQILAAAAHLKK